MSRRLLLAAGGDAGSVVVPEDPDGGGLGGDSAFPATTDPTLALLRPTGTRVTATRTAAPGSQIGPNLATLYAEMDESLETPYGKETPDHFGILYLPPGQYRGGFGTGKWMAIIGLGDNPEDVVIFNDTIAADGVMHTFSPVHIENLTIKAEHNYEIDQSPKYCVHIGGSARTTFANVIFDSTEADTSTTDSTWSGGATVGMDGGPGVSIIFYKCQFYPKAGGGVGMNMHGGMLGYPHATVSYIDCIAPQGVQYSYGAGADNPANVDDEMYVIGGNIGSDIVASDNVHVYTNLDNPITGAGFTTPAITRNHSDWPKPVAKGFNQFSLDYFYPSGLFDPGVTDIVADVDDVAPMTLVSGRTYYCPVPVEKTYWFKNWGIHVRSGPASAGFGWKASPDQETFYGSGAFVAEPHEDIRNIAITGDWPNPGKMMEPYFDRSWIAFPATPHGGNRMWFAFKIGDSTGATVDGSAMLPGLHDCWYSDDNGATITKATAGTPFPLAHAAQVR